MANFRVKCIKSEDDRFEVGKIYEIDDATGNMVGDKYPSCCVSRCTDSFSSWYKACNWASYDFIEIPLLPRICYLLGGEETPLEIGERFEIEGYEINPCYIQENGTVCNRSAIVIGTTRLCCILNNPERIIRKPTLNFSEDEKAFLRICVAAGYPWAARDPSGEFYFYDEKPKYDERSEEFTNKSKIWLMVISLLPQITFENSPLDVAGYLEGLNDA